MKFNGPFYEGDSIIRHGSGYVEQQPATTIEASAEPVIVQRSSRPATGFTLDSWAIEKRARRMRSEYVWSLASALAEHLSNWFERARQRDLDAYLGASQSHAELEERIQRLERAGGLRR